jgi:hypothetical protein
MAVQADAGATAALAPIFDLESEIYDTRRGPIARIRRVAAIAESAIALFTEKLDNNAL